MRKRRLSRESARPSRRWCRLTSRFSTIDGSPLTPTRGGRTFAHDGLRGTGLLCYAPQELRIVRHARKEEQVQRPLFPRYCFIGVPARGQVEAAYGVRGVSWLLGGWEQPSIVSVCAILELAMAERAGMFDHTSRLRITPPM